MGAEPATAFACVTATQLVRDFPNIRRLMEQGPVRITSHGRTEALLISAECFKDLTNGGPAEDAECLGLKLSLVLESIEAQVLILDEELIIRRVNRLVAESFKISAEAMVGLHITAVMQNLSDKFVIQRLSEVLRTGLAEVLVVPSSRRLDRTIRFHLRPWPKGVALFAEDITEREQIRDKKIADTALDRSLDVLGGLGTALVLSNGTVITASPGLCHMTGSSSDLLIGARLQHLFEPQSRAVVNEALTDKSSETVCYEVEYLRDGVSARVAVLSITPYWTAEKHACFAIALRDPEFEKPQCKLRVVRSPDDRGQRAM